MHNDNSRPALDRPNPIVALDSPRASATDQVIVVSADDWDQNRVRVAGWRRVDNDWSLELAPVPGWLGPNGFTDDPSELDWYTPVGSYAITLMFGHLSNPGTKFDYHQVTGNAWWPDDPDSYHYNTWQEGDPAGRWESAEWLAMYPHAFAFDFNQHPVVPHRNSAIFFHEGSGPTAGCIAVSRPDLVEFMCWLDPALRPRIHLGIRATPPA